MSNPLSSLNKNKRLPMRVPGKKPEYAVYGDTSIREPYKDKPPSREKPRPGVPKKTKHPFSEEELLEDVFGQVADDVHRTARRGTGQPEAFSSPRVISSDELSDSALLKSLMGRLARMEAQCTVQQKEAKEKDRKIKILEDKLRLYQRSKVGGQRERDLEKRCLSLQKQVHDMEAFLADYGMQWVGGEDLSADGYISDDLSDDDVSKDPALPVPISSRGKDASRGKETSRSLQTDPLWRPETSQVFAVDFNLVVQNIRDLNALAGEGEGKVQQTVNGARIKVTDSIPLALYHNGMILWSGPFRPYEDATTRHFLIDIMDGFFPSELQPRFPDGVPFQVTDKRGVVFKQREKLAFVGAGQVLGGEVGPSRLVPSNLRDEQGDAKAGEELGLPVEHQLPGRQLTVDQFLNSLPSAVMREGRVIDIRSDIGQQLQASSGKPTTVTVVETEPMKDIQTRVTSARAGEAPMTPRDLATLRVATEGGDQLILKLRFNDTLATVASYVAKQRPELASQEFELVGGFPRRVFSDARQTLQQAGLVPNAVLHVRAKPKT